MESASDFEIVGVGSSEEEAIQVVKEFSPDIVLINPFHSSMHGLTTIQRILKSCSGTKIVIITEGNCNFICKLDKYSIYGYLNKSIDPDRLVHYLYNIYAEEKNMLGIEKRTCECSLRSKIEEIPIREIEVLIKMSAGSTDQEISRFLKRNIHTVRKHVSNILKKFHVKNRTQVVSYMQTGVFISGRNFWSMK
ncbi:response regulator transcription factor [Fodinisporobacter ferrooxydans]|uniref:Response regulator transcription factor n=1 Tax=Fodinisporobacter ferrooxydans TaxID=2901836 RepID=A0ABY4CNC7_9BACL|nr:response regulator transcription factor [Alicyclobacillaceae bacterium MYW30-H2]